MKYIRLALLLALIATPAAAQWQVPNNSVPLGRGAGVTGFRSAAPATAGHALVSNGPGVDPTFQALVPSYPNQNANVIFGGPASGAAAAPGFRSLVAADIAANMLDYTKIAQAPAFTVPCNPTASLANITNCTPAQVRATIAVDSQIGVGDADCGTLSTSVSIVGFNTTQTATRNCNLPAANAAGYNAGTRITFVDVGNAISSAFPRTITPNGANTINNLNSPFAMSTRGGSVTFETDGVSKWTIISNTSVGILTWQVFGAIGNNVVDDTTAINLALQSPYETYCTPGTYRVTALAASNSGVKVRGPGGACRIVGVGSTTANILTIGDGANDMYNPDIQGIKIWSATTRTAGAAVLLQKVRNQRLDIQIGSPEDFTADGNRLFNGLVINQFAIVDIKGTVVWGASNDCVTAYGNSSNTFGVGLFTGPTNFFSNCGRDGVVISGGTGGVNLDINVQLVGRYGIRVDTTLAGTNNREIFFGPNLATDSNNSYGIYFGPNSTFLANCSGCWIAGNKAAGVYIDPTQITTSGGANFMFSGALIYSNRGAGIQDAGVGSNTIVTGSAVILNGSVASGGSGANGILLDGKTSGSFTGTGNRIDSNGQGGVGFGFAVNAAGALVNFTGNTLTNNSQGNCLLGVGSITQNIRNNVGCMYGTPYVMPQARLTPSTGVPVVPASVAGATSIFYAPYVGNQGIVIDDATANYPVNVTISQCSQALSDTTKSPAAAVANSNYDVFTWQDTSTSPATFRCTRGPAWTNATTRASAIAIGTFGGVYVNSTAITNGPAAGKGVYVGSFRTNASGTVDYTFGSSASGGGAAFLSVWNMYNRVAVSTTVTESTAPWSYPTPNTTPRPINNSTNNRVSFISGLPLDTVKVTAMTSPATPATSGSFMRSGFALDATNVLDKQATITAPGPNAINASLFVGNTYAPQTGFHFIQATEVGDGSTLASWFGGPAQGLTVDFMQ